MTSRARKDKDGNIRWSNEKDQLHRENGPAVECADGTKEWYVYGQLHRENGPAIEHSSGAKEWYIHGHRHRENGHAVEWGNGKKEWWVSDKTGPEIELKVKENIARLQQKELLGVLCQDQDISDKINTSSLKISKKL